LVHFFVPLLKLAATDVAALSAILQISVLQPPLPFQPTNLASLFAGTPVRGATVPLAYLAEQVEP